MARPDATSDPTLQGKAAAETLIPEFKFERLLNQDQHSRRISLLGTISLRPALLVLERATLPSDSTIISDFLQHITSVRNLGANDVYHWYMANRQVPTRTATPPFPDYPSDLKLNLIYPCTPQHISKYSSQRVRIVHETPQIYRNHIRPFIIRQRDLGRLSWVFNIIEGRTEQEDVILRSHQHSRDDEGFLLLPDLNWDRKTMDALHLLALVERRDVWSLRDLKKRHVEWLRVVRRNVLEATVKLYGEMGIEEDGLKCYVHYQPTYYHFHIHVVNVLLEAGNTQAVGKAFGLENLISQLETMCGGPDAGLADVELTYFLGEESELWREVFGPLKSGALKAEVATDSGLSEGLVRN